MPKYQLPSINSSICLPDGRRISAPDGVIDTDALGEAFPGLDEYMREMVRVHNAWPYNPKAKLRPQINPLVSKAQAPSKEEMHAAAADAAMAMFS